MQDVVHLLSRIALGERPGQIEHVQSIGVDKYLDQQLHPERIDDSAAEKRLEGIASIHMSAPALVEIRPPQQILQDLQAQKIVRAVHSERQLQEVMTDFWFNHFNVFWRQNADRWFTTGYEMNAIGSGRITL